MSEKKSQSFVKTETTLLIAFIALTIGFVGGVVFGVYKSGSTSAPQGGGMPPSANASADHTAKIKELKELIVKTPEDVDTWIQLGHLYFDSNQIKEAISAYETALGITPDNPDVITDLGVMYRRAGNPEEAIAKFDQAMALDKSHQVSRFNKGIVLMHDLNDQKGAIAAWRELVEINPEAKAPNGELVSAFIARIEKQNEK